MPDGERFTDAPKTSDRSAWCIVRKHTEKTEQQAREIIKTWLKNWYFVVATSERGCGFRCDEVIIPEDDGADDAPAARDPRLR